MPKETDSRPDNRIVVVMGPHIGKRGRILKRKGDVVTVRLGDSEVHSLPHCHVEYARGH